ncbi:MAG: glycosyltransferase family 4 protein, partial [Candidatus Methylopumilus sp.]
MSDNSSGKTIWFVSQYAGGPGIGMQYRHYQLAKELLTQGHKAIIISGSFSHLYLNPPNIERNGDCQYIDGVKYVWVKNPKYVKSISLGRFWNMLVFAWNLMRLDVNTLPIPDAVIVSSPSMMPITSALRWRRRLGCKLCFEVRDIWPLTLQELGKLSYYHPLIIFMRYFERLAYKKSDIIISLLPNALNHYVSNGMHPSKFRYLPNGVESAKIHCDSDFYWPEAIGENAFVVGYGGSIGKANAIRYLIDAARILKAEMHIHFVIIGK